MKKKKQVLTLAKRFDGEIIFYIKYGTAVRLFFSKVLITSTTLIRFSTAIAFVPGENCRKVYL